MPEPLLRTKLFGPSRRGREASHARAGVGQTPLLSD